jgi:hypothetical protein
VREGLSGLIEMRPSTGRPRWAAWPSGPACQHALVLSITEIVWLMQFMEKIREKHGLRTEEVEDVLERRPRVHRIERGRVQGEPL